jgi:hypothetical protein
MVKEGIRGYLESLITRSEEIPTEPSPASIGARRNDDLSHMARPPANRCDSGAAWGGFFLDQAPVP